MLITIDADHNENDPNAEREDDYSTTIPPKEEKFLKNLAEPRTCRVRRIEGSKEYMDA